MRLLFSSPILALSLFLTALASISAAQVAEGPWLELPDGPAAKAFAAIDPAAEVPELKLSSPPPLSEADGWQAWAKWLNLAADPASERRADARTALLALAIESGRSEEAWSHFAALQDSPGHSVAVLSRLLPGVPAGTKIALGGAPGPLPDGVLLRPTIPPAAPLASGGLRGRKALVRGLQIGEARVDFEITFDAYGVQVDLTLVEGDAANVRVILPEPSGFTIRVEYVDWMRQDDLGGERLVELLPETPKITLFGRILPRKKLYPRAEPGLLSRGLELSGLLLALPQDETEEAAELLRMRAVASAMAQASGLQVALQTPEDGVQVPGATLIQLPAAGPDREALLRWLVSSIEAHRLHR